MRLLLDTHILLWAAYQPARLSQSARALIEDEANQLLFSPASLWEIVIKRALGRPDFTADARQLRRGLTANGYAELPITGEHVLGVAALPDISKDPFDRLLVAQAVAEGVLLLSGDASLGSYPSVRAV